MERLKEAKEKLLTGGGAVFLIRLV